MLTMEDRIAYLQSTPVQQVSNTLADQQRADHLVLAPVAAARSQMHAALMTDFSLRPLATKLQACGRNAWVEYHAARNEYRCVAPCCKLRVCPRCAKLVARRSTQVAHAIVTNTKPLANHAWKLLTLTVCHTSAPLAHQLDAIVAAFRRLRQRALWKHHVSHGIATVQITYNSASDQWHPHIHAVIFAKFTPQPALSKAWKEITKGSHIVDIRPAGSGEDACSYATRYITRPLEHDTDPPNESRLCEFAKAMMKRRMLIRFGNCDAEIAEEPPVTGWTVVASLAALVHDARLGSEKSQAILRCVAPFAYVEDLEPITIEELCDTT